MHTRLRADKIESNRLTASGPIVGGKFPYRFCPVIESETPSASCEENTCSTARAASCSSSPAASISRAVPIVAHNDRMLKMLRRSAALPLHFIKIVELNLLLNRTRFAAGRRCNPSRQGTTTVERFIPDFRQTPAGSGSIFAPRCERNFRILAGQCYVQFRMKGFPQAFGDLPKKPL